MCTIAANAALMQVHDLVLGFLHQHVQPLAQIGRHHVHQAESRHHLVPEHLKLLRVQEDELHLHNGQHGAGGRRQRNEHILAAGHSVQLKVLAELQARVDHAADAERNGADAQIEAAVPGDRLAQWNRRCRRGRRMSAASVVCKQKVYKYICRGHIKLHNTHETNQSSRTAHASAGAPCT